MSALEAILAKARNADCPKCSADPLEDCWPHPHIDRLIRAWRHGQISDGEMTYFIAARHTAELEAALEATIGAVTAERAA